MGDNQHTVPQLYLRPFFPCWVYRLGEKEPRWVQSTKKEQQHNKYYGSLDELNTYIEGAVAPTYKKFIDNPQSTTTVLEQYYLSIFFANIFLRNPLNIAQWRSIRISMTKKLTGKLESINIGSSASRLRRELEMLQEKGGYHYAVGDNLSIVVDIAECIFHMSLFIHEAPEGICFVTSDNPLILENYWGNNDALAQIPLSPSKILFMKYHETHIIKIGKTTPEQVGLINQDTIKYSKEKIYSKVKYDKAYDWMMR